MCPGGSRYIPGSGSHGNGSTGVGGSDPFTGKYSFVKGLTLYVCACVSTGCNVWFLQLIL